jgi:flagellar protein FliS
MATNSQYLESKILTAPPHRLHLMLIDGAIRCGRQAEEAFRAGDAETAAGPLMRALEIVGEMLVGVRHGSSELNTRMAQFYWFLFCRLSEAKIHSDGRPLAEALRLLEYERTTWQLVCDKAGQTPAAETPKPAPPHAAPERSLSLEA